MVAARRLRSGDILVTTKDPKAKARLQKEPQWLEGVGTSVEIRRKRYMVIVHGIRRAQLDTSDQKKAFTEIYAQNQGLKGRVEILGATWARRTPKEGTLTSPLLLSVAEPAQGDILIDEGFLWNYQLHNCKPFYGGYKITQCFKCY